MIGTNVCSPSVSQKPPTSPSISSARTALGVLLDEVRRAVKAALLLIGHRGEDQVAMAPDLGVAREELDRHRAHRHHVSSYRARRAPQIMPSSKLRAERIVRPRLGARRHHRRCGRRATAVRALRACSRAASPPGLRAPSSAPPRTARSRPREASRPSSAQARCSFPGGLVVSRRSSARNSASDSRSSSAPSSASSKRPDEEERGEEGVISLLCDVALCRVGLRRRSSARPLTLSQAGRVLCTLLRAWARACGPVKPGGVERAPCVF